MRAFHWLLIAGLVWIGSLHAQQANELSFFVTSKGSGKGGDLGGLEGADRHCQELAVAVGAGNRVWRAYLSTSGDNPVNARDRIGKGPWKNARGVVIAASVDELHGENKIDQSTALTETGSVVPGSKDRGSSHDMMTGSTSQGRAFPPDRGDRTCANWTSSGDGVVTVGHHDRMGITNDEENRSWNSAHRSRGCSLAGLGKTAGDGRFYCFAAD